MKTEKTKEIPLVEQIGFCLTLHFADFNNIDAEIKSCISDFLQSFPTTKWKKGNYWSKSTFDNFNTFPVSFDQEIKDHKKYYEGIQTRNIGNIVIEDPSIVFKDNITSQYIISFRKIHDSYCVMFIAISKNIHLKLLDCPQIWENLETQTKKLIEILWKNLSDKFKNNLLGPTTVFYLLTKTTSFFNLPEIVEKIINEDSILYIFLQKFLCAKGVKLERIPLSTLDDKVIVLRHPSYNFSPEMSEKFLFLPIEVEEIEFYMRKIDILSSIEYYFTQLFAYAKVAGHLLEKLDKESSPIFALLKKFRFSSTDRKKTKILSELRESRMELLEIYHLANKVRDEIEHVYEDISYLIDGALASSSHSQTLEKQISNEVEGVIKSIGIETQMRVKHVEMYVSRIGGRSYGLSSEVSKILNEYQAEASSNNMLKSTNQIRLLTIILAIFTGVMIIPQILFIIKKLIPYVLYLISILSQ